MAKPESLYYRGLSDQLQRDVQGLSAGQAGRVAAREGDIDLNITNQNHNGTKPKQDRRKYTIPGRRVLQPATLGEIARIKR